MKLAFSTLGCPEFGWSDVYSMAKDLGFQGIEVRGLGDELFDGKTKPFQQENLPKTLAQLKKIRMNISCISSGACLKFPEKAEETRRELLRSIDVASQLEAPFVRILGDLSPAPDGEVDDAVVLKALKALIPYAEEKGVTLLVETNGVYADTSRLASLLNQIESDSIGALWDMHHPYRYGNETPEQTVQNLGAYIKYTHIKDSVMENGRVAYKMMGEGDLPVDAIMRALRSINYEGYISLEWLKSYMPELNDAGVVFPQFTHFMSQYLGGADESRRLYDDNRKTGKYVWPKEHLIDLTFPQVLDRMVEEFPDQYAFRYTTLDYTRTYAEFRDDVDTFARALIAMGVRPGDHVAIWATNVPQWYYYLLGHYQDRRGAGNRQHRLQNPRGRIFAPPV